MADKATPVVVPDGLVETISAKGFTRSSTTSNWNLSTKTIEQKYELGAALVRMNPALEWDSAAALKDQTILFVLKAPGVGGNITCRKANMLTFQGAHAQYFRPLKEVKVEEADKAVIAAAKQPAVA